MSSLRRLAATRPSGVSRFASSRRSTRLATRSCRLCIARTSVTRLCVVASSRSSRAMTTVMSSLRPATSLTRCSSWRAMKARSTSGISSSGRERAQACRPAGSCRRRAPSGVSMMPCFQAVCTRGHGADRADRPLRPTPATPGDRLLHSVDRRAMSRGPAERGARGTRRPAGQPLQCVSRLRALSFLARVRLRSDHLGRQPHCGRPALAVLSRMRLATAGSVKRRMLE
jgi:hypothetical protein